jgi:hypothetical protein
MKSGTSLHRGGNVGEQLGPLTFVKKIKKRAGLAVIVIALPGGRIDQHTGESPFTMEP